MEITQIQVFPVAADKLRAFVSLVLDDCFVVCDIKIIEGNHGLFVSMPSKRRKDGTFRDIAHPLNSQTRRRFEERIIAKYREVVSSTGGDCPAHIRELGPEDGTIEEPGQLPPGSEHGSSAS
jgi:stage V sporulation protein G